MGRQTKYNNGIRTVFHFVFPNPNTAVETTVEKQYGECIEPRRLQLQVTNFVQRMKLGSIWKANRYCNIDVSSLTGAHGGAGAFYNRGVGWAAWQSLVGKVGEEKQRTPSAHQGATV